MTTGLSVNNIVSVQVNLTPQQASFRDFGAILLIGDSDVIDGSERMVLYDSLDAVTSAFGTSAPEYLAAVLHFDQNPQPEELYIGRWLRTATSALLKGGILSSSEQEMSNWTSITDGSFSIDIDGITTDVTLLDFSAQSNLNGVAAEIDSGLAGASCIWDGSRFVITSDTTGTSSTLSYAEAVDPATGTDISAQLKLTDGLALPPVDGFAAETALEAVTELANFSSKWYGCCFGASVMPSDDDLVSIAGFIEGASPDRVLGVTTQNTLTLDGTYTTDLPSRLKDLDYEKSLSQFSTYSPYHVISTLARNAVVNFQGNNTTITTMFKQNPGTTAETLTQQQANVLKDKRCNVYVEYQNDTNIIQYGEMCANIYIDTRWGIDWLTDAIQTNCYNLLYANTTKIPQTDAGNTQVKAAIEAALVQGVNNGLIAPGVWNAPGFGNLSTGDYLDSGYYVFQPSVASQPQSEREQRKSVTFQVAVKLAGAIHSVDIVVDVNR